MKIDLIFLIVLGMIIFYVFITNKIESMADVGQLTEDRVKELIYQTYLMDVTAIKNLSDVAVKLQSGGLTIPGNLTVQGELNIQDANTKLVKGDGNSLRISTPSGFVDIGSRNNDWAHIYTDRPKFAFNKQLTDTSVEPYNDYIKNGNVKISGNLETAGNINTNVLTTKSVNTTDTNTTKITIDGITINKEANRLKVNGSLNPNEIWMDKCKQIKFQNTWDSGYVSLIAGCNGGQGGYGNWLVAHGYKNDGGWVTGPLLKWD